MYLYIALAIVFVFILPHFLHHLGLALHGYESENNPVMSDQELQTYALSDVFANLPRIIAGSPAYNYNTFVGPHVMSMFYGLDKKRYPEYLLHRAVNRDAGVKEAVIFANGFNEEKEKD